MSHPMKYIKDLEAVGFQRNQAEAQVQIVLDVLEGDLVTKSDLNLFREQVDRRFAEFREQVDRQFAEFREQVDRRFIEVAYQFKEVDARFKELELRLTIKLGLITLSVTTVAVAILGWLIKTQA